MRLCAGLVLTAAACLGGASSSADAANYCAGSVPSSFGCNVSFGGIQEALDAAADQAGPDTVYIAAGQHALATGVVYSDRGQADRGRTRSHFPTTPYAGAEWCT